MTTDVFICDTVRTPIGRYGGALAAVRTDDLAAVPIRELLERHPALAETTDEVFLGCAKQAGEDNRNVARMALLLAGLSETVPGTTINRLCASGLDAVGTAARAIRAGEIDLAIAGGVESMTRAPLVMGKAESAFQRSAEIHDTTIGWRFINPLMKTLYGIDSMSETARVYPLNSLSGDPPSLFPGYKSTVLRSPSPPLAVIPHTLSELSGPVYGHESVLENDSDLTRQHKAEPLGEPITVSGDDEAVFFEA